MTKEDVKTRQILDELGYDIFLDENLLIKPKVKFNESKNGDDEEKLKEGTIFFKRHE
jgi:hypothetical protein